MAKGSAACAISNATTSSSFDPRAHPECPIPDYSSQGRTPAFTHLSRIRRTVIRISEATAPRRRACITRLETFNIRDERNSKMQAPPGSTMKRIRPVVTIWGGKKRTNANATIITEHVRSSVGAQSELSRSYSRSSVGA